jgi:hypothetical protein
MHAHAVAKFGARIKRGVREQDNIVSQAAIGSHEIAGVQNRTRPYLRAFADNAMR